MLEPNVEMMPMDIEDVRVLVASVRGMLNAGLVASVFEPEIREVVERVERSLPPVDDEAVES